MLGSFAESRAKNTHLRSVACCSITTKVRSRFCATYFARSGHPSEEFHRGLILMLVDPHTTITRPFKTIRHRTKGGTYHQFDTSLHVVVTRASDKYHTAHEARLPHLDGSQGRCCWRGVSEGACAGSSRNVSSNMPACRFHGVVHLILYLFVAWIASTLDFIVCGLFHGCSGVWMLLIWSVLLGFIFLNFGYSICECCGWIVSELALSSRSAVAQVPSYFERWFQHETKVVSHRVRGRIWKQRMCQIQDGAPIDFGLDSVSFFFLRQLPRVVRGVSMQLFLEKGRHHPAAKGST